MHDIILDAPERHYAARFAELGLGAAGQDSSGHIKGRPLIEAWHRALQTSTLFKIGIMHYGAEYSDRLTGVDDTSRKQIIRAYSTLGIEDPEQLGAMVDEDIHHIAEAAAHAAAEFNSHIEQRVETALKYSRPQSLTEQDDRPPTRTSTPYR